MFDPVTISAAVATASTAFNGIKRAFAAGKELEAMSQDLSRWMGAVSDVDAAHKSAKNPTMFRKVFSGGTIEQEAIEAFTAKKKLEEQTLETIQRRTPFSMIPASNFLTDDKPFRIIDLSTPDKLERHTLKLSYSLLSQKPSPLYPVLVPPPCKYVEGGGRCLDGSAQKSQESLGHTYSRRSWQRQIIHGGHAPKSGARRHSSASHVAHPRDSTHHQGRYDFTLVESP